MKTNSSNSDPKVIQSKLWRAFFALNPVVKKITTEIKNNIKIMEEAQAENDVLTVEELQEKLIKLTTILENTGELYLKLSSRLGFADVNKIKLQ